MAQSIEFRITRRLQSKPRIVPYAVPLPDGRVELVSFNEPAVQLLESLVSHEARRAVRKWEEASGGTWDSYAEFRVDIEFGEVYSGRNADLDNLAKLVLDGLVGVCFDRDSRVSELRVLRSHKKDTQVRVAAI